ncbi:MAG: uroporphyrinogen decarboxylase family protein [Syntrophorhabdaceae bacterium]|nr:uroporphyrinogen decarboxylase family protein [Syntrophorhabdaceae bacterium]
MKLKQDRMSSAERIDSLFNYRRPDHVPIGMIAPSFSCRNAGLPVSVAYNDPEHNFYAMQWAAEQYAWDQAPQIVRHTIVEVMDFGGDVRLPEGEYEGALVVNSYPVKSESDVENLQMPDPEKTGMIGAALELGRLQKAHGLPVTFVSRSPFTVASNICGLQQFCKWLIKKPELCERLMKMAIDHIFNVLRYWVDTFGAEEVFVFMSSPSESNQVISPKQFEKFALPYHLLYHERLKALGIKRFYFHVCGEQNLNLPYLADASSWEHPAILSFGHEVSLETAAQYFQKDIICGNIEPAIIQTGTTQQVYEIAGATLEKGKDIPGGFILSAGCELPIAAPAANVFAITKAADDFGWYPEQS